jgi:hypothetical protein
MDEYFFYLKKKFCPGCVLRPGAVCGLLRITLLHGGFGEFVAQIGGC